jgi:chemotaxis protein CheY-P-specific phosphatase CheC
MPVRLLGAKAILAGVVAHVFKKQNKLLYGRVEVLFGMSSAAAIASLMREL